MWSSGRTALTARCTNRAPFSAASGAELVALGGAEVERLLDEQRLVEEVGLRGDQGQGGPVAGQVVQCEQGLDSRDAAPDDDHAGPGVTLLSVHS